MDRRSAQLARVVCRGLALVGASYSGCPWLYMVDVAPDVQVVSRDVIRGTVRGHVGDDATAAGSATTEAAA